MSQSIKSITSSNPTHTSYKQTAMGPRRPTPASSGDPSRLHYVRVKRVCRPKRVYYSRQYVHSRVNFYPPSEVIWWNREMLSHSFCLKCVNAFSQKAVLWCRFMFPNTNVGFFVSGICSVCGGFNRQMLTLCCAGPEQAPAVRLPYQSRAKS